jgi:Peroxin 13, N-terminal region
MEAMEAMEATVDTAHMGDMAPWEVVLVVLWTTGINLIYDYRTIIFILNTYRFIAAAEESTQHAFQSLESIVRAFGSISMMLDSTFNAVHSSFRAVLGMADQFSRLRSHLSRVFSALAIFRTAKWAYLKLLYFMGQYDTKFLLSALFCLFIVYKIRSDTTESQHPCFSRCVVNRLGRSVIRG